MVITNPVIIRIDDFQDYWIHDVQTAVLNVASSRSVPVLAGGIMSALGTLGDTVVVNALKNLQTNNLVEFGVHGWKHEDYSQKSLLQQVYEIQLANNQMYKNFGVKSRIFLPPMNKFDTDTLTALQTDNYGIFSSDTGDDTLTSGYWPHVADSYGLLHIPWTVLLCTWDSVNLTYVMRPIADILASVQTSLNTYGWCVIATHFQEFAVYSNGSATNVADSNKIAEYGQVIDQLKTQGKNFTTFAGLTNTKTMVSNDIIVG